MAHQGFADLLSEYAEAGISRSQQLIQDTCRRCGHADLAEKVCNTLIDEKICNKMRRRQKRDPNAPKSAKTSYQIFSDEQLPKIRAKDSSLEMGEVFKKLGVLWNKLSDDQKQPYVELAAKDKERYLAEKHAHDNELAKSKVGKLSGPGTTVGGSADDAPPCVEVANSTPLFTVIMGEVAQTLLRGYRQIITQTCQACGQPEMADTLCQELLDEKMVRTAFPKQRKDPNAPKAAKTSYQIFSMSTRSAVVSKNPKLTLGQISKKLGQMWASLDDTKRQAWVKKANADKARYTKEKAAYDEKIASEATLVPVEKA